MNWITTGCSWSPQWQKERQRQTKVGKIYYFVSSIHFHLIHMQKCIECPRIFKDEMVHKGWNIYILWRIFIEIFCYHVNRLLVSFWNINLTELQFSRRKLSPKKGNFGPKLPPPDAQCRFLLEVEKMPQRVVSSELLTTHKVWAKVLFDHFQFCSILSNILS